MGNKVGGGQRGTLIQNIINLPLNPIKTVLYQINYIKMIIVKILLLHIYQIK